MNKRGPFIWTQLHLPVPLELDAARAALTALAGVGGQPRLVLEVSGQAGVISWRLGCDTHIAPRIVAALEAHLAGLRHERRRGGIDGLLSADRAAVIRLPGSRGLPLRRDVAEPVTRGVLAALARAGRGERLDLQLILGPRKGPSRASVTDRRDQRAASLKFSEHRFACEVRLAASTGDPARARSLISGVVAALRGLEAPGVSLRATSSSVHAFSRTSSPWLWSSVLSVSDLIPFTGWPIGELPLPGMPAAHPRLVPVLASVPTTGRVLGISSVSVRDRPIAISVTDSLKHLHVLGPTGVGKSTLLARLALDDIEQGRGVVVIDPKGDLVEDLLARVPEGRLEDVVVLDALDVAPVGINGLGKTSNPDLAADALLGVFHSLYADSWGPRTQDILHACLLTLARRGDASLVMVPLLLTNPGFRRSVLGQVVKADPMGLGSFWGWFDALSDAERQTAIAPLMNKLRPVLLRPGIRAVLGQRRPRFELSDVFTKQRILLVSLSKGVLGPEASQLLGSLVVSLLWTAALGRAGTPADKRAPVMIHVDEVQDYLRLPGDLGDALAQARGLGVGFTLAHQHLGQLLPTALREAVLANARSRVAFQLSSRDARELARETRSILTAEDFETLPAFHAYASLLVDNTPLPWVSLSTRALPPAVRDGATVRALSRAAYGLPLDEIEADLLALTDPQTRSSEPLGRTRRSTPKPPEGGSHD